ncbi:MAG: UDP-N-acetylmuramoyl-L-alanine--D-glutamate ligase [Clostridia bacterium]|nr:UDP-N-acetylmuramoyl-L-alanine--D-glutamate ligase [Clostridia bacterium]
MYPEQQIFFVLGLSRSGRAAAEFLLSKNAVVYIYDDVSGERVEQSARELVAKGAKRVAKEMLGKTAETCDVLVLSPGIPIDHPLAVAFKRRGKAVVGETELAARYMRCPIVAVTGTNGKTTTVSMLAEVLQKGGLNAKACGNIGSPMIDYCTLDEKSVAVAEISSFQLETLNSLCPHISLVLNITEDHLNRHYNMENYIFLKAKLLKNASESEYAVLNFDDGIVRGFAEKTKAQTVWFSVREKVRGAYYENGDLYFNDEKIMPASDLLAEGVHNIQNALAVIAASKIMGVKTKDIAEALASFKGIKHRIETVDEVCGVAYVDDSKGTNADATIKAVQCMKRKTLLLLGGKNKGYDYSKLFTALKNSNVVHAILYGENRYALLKSAREQGFESVTVCETFAFAVRIAAMLAKRGQTVLLSPASASFDEFTSYEERGDAFVEIVRSLKQKSASAEQSLQTEPSPDGNETVDGDEGDRKSDPDRFQADVEEIE